jgi:hypothetical protein
MADKQGRGAAHRAAKRSRGPIDGRLLRVHVNHCGPSFELPFGFHGPMQGQGALASFAFLCQNPNGIVIV